MQGPVNPVNEGIQVAIVECTVVDGAERRIRSILLEFLLDVLDHRHGLVPSAEFSSLHAEHGCGGQRRPQDQSKINDGGTAHEAPPPLEIALIRRRRPQYFEKQITAWQ